MGEKLNKESKVMNVVEAQTIRELVDYTNYYKIPREDIVSILHSKEGYMLIFYY